MERTRAMLPCVEGGGAPAERSPRLSGVLAQFRFFTTPSFGALPLLPPRPTHSRSASPLRESDGREMQRLLTGPSS
jgi:hypothetical protein